MLKRRKGEIGTIIVMVVLVLVSVIGFGSSKFLEKIESSQSLDEFKASFKDGTFFA